jgi:hypothetical protein
MSVEMRLIVEADLGRDRCGRPPLQQSFPSPLDPRPREVRMRGDADGDPVVELVHSGGLTVYGTRHTVFSHQPRGRPV